MAKLNDLVSEINTVKRIFKDNRLQAEYEQRMKTFARPMLTTEQNEKVRKVKELSARFFEKLTKYKIDSDQAVRQV